MLGYLLEPELKKGMMRIRRKIHSSHHSKEIGGRLHRTFLDGILNLPDQGRVSGSERVVAKRPNSR